MRNSRPILITHGPFFFPLPAMTGSTCASRTTSQLLNITVSFFHSISIDPVGDDEQIEKTLSTLHSTNPVLSTQYQNMRFTKYSELIAHMMLAEKRQLFLLQNTKTQPPGTLPPQVQTETHFNAPQTTAQSSARGRGNQRGFPI